MQQGQEENEPVFAQLWFIFIQTDKEKNAQIYCERMAPYHKENTDR